MIAHAKYIHVFSFLLLYIVKENEKKRQREFLFGKSAPIGLRERERVMREKKKKRTAFYGAENKEKTKSKKYSRKKKVAVHI